MKLTGYYQLWIFPTFLLGLDGLVEGWKIFSGILWYGLANLICLIGIFVLMVLKKSVSLPSKNWGMVLQAEKALSFVCYLFALGYGACFGKAVLLGATFLAGSLVVAANKENFKKPKVYSELGKDVGLRIRKERALRTGSWLDFETSFVQWGALKPAWKAPGWVGWLGPISFLLVLLLMKAEVDGEPSFFLLLFVGGIAATKSVFDLVQARSFFKSEAWLG